MKRKHVGRAVSNAGSKALVPVGRASRRAGKPPAKRTALPKSSPSDEEPEDATRRERFTVMRAIVPVSMKAFVYAQRQRMGLDTPSEYVRVVLRDLMEAHEEFELEKRGFDEVEHRRRSPSRRSKGARRSD